MLKVAKGRFYLRVSEGDGFFEDRDGDLPSTRCTNVLKSFASIESESKMIPSIQLVPSAISDEKILKHARIKFIRGDEKDLAFNSAHIVYIDANGKFIVPMEHRSTWLGDGHVTFSIIGGCRERVSKRLELPVETVERELLEEVIEVNGVRPSVSVYPGFVLYIARFNVVIFVNLVDTIDLSVTDVIRDYKQLSIDNLRFFKQINMVSRFSLYIYTYVGVAFRYWLKKHIQYVLNHGIECSIHG